MPPNSQNQIPSNQSEQPASSNVPEYLQLGPIADPSAERGRRKKRLFVVIVGAIIFMLACVVGVYAYSLWQQTTPQEQFYKLLEKQMQIGYVTKKYSLTDKQFKDDKLDFDVMSDFSDPANPKSKVTYTYGNSKRGDNLVQGEQILTGDKEFFGKLMKSPRGVSTAGIKINDWYKLADSSEDTSVDTFDFLGLRTEVNSPLGYYVAGNMSAATRQYVMDLVKEKKVYTVSETRNEILQGEKITVFSVLIDGEALEEVNKAVAKSLDLAAPVSFLSPMYVDGLVQFWVGEKENVLKRIVFSTKVSPNSASLTGSVNLEYPSSMDIQIPSQSQRMKSAQ